MFQLSSPIESVILVPARVIGSELNYGPPQLVRQRNQIIRQKNQILPEIIRTIAPKEILIQQPEGFADEPIHSISFFSENGETIRNLRAIVATHSGIAVLSADVSGGIEFPSHSVEALLLSSGYTPTILTLTNPPSEVVMRPAVRLEIGLHNEPALCTIPEFSIRQKAPKEALINHPWLDLAMDEKWTSSIDGLVSLPYCFVLELNNGKKIFLELDSRVFAKSQAGIEVELVNRLEGAFRDALVVDGTIRVQIREEALTGFE